MSSNRSKHIASLVERPNVCLDNNSCIYFWWDLNDCVTLQLFKAAGCANLPKSFLSCACMPNVRIVLSYFRIRVYIYIYICIFKARTFNVCFQRQRISQTFSITSNLLLLTLLEKAIRIEHVLRRQREETRRERKKTPTEKSSKTSSSNINLISMIITVLWLKLHIPSEQKHDLSSIVGSNASLNMANYSQHFNQKCGLLT